MIKMKHLNLITRLTTTSLIGFIGFIGFIGSGCNNNQLDRLSSKNECDPKADLASFELLENENEIFELITNGLPTESNFETTGFTITKVDGDIISSFTPNGLFSDNPRLAISCAGGFVINKPASGSFEFSVPTLNADQELNVYDFSVDYDTKRSKSGLTVFSLEEPATLVPIEGSDILEALVSRLGYDEVHLYTFVEGSQKNIVFIAHARNSVGVTLRLRLQQIAN